MPITINTYCRVNRNGSININTDPTFPEPPPNFMCVSGAGSAEVNGTYTFAGFETSDGYTRPKYIKGIFKIGLSILGGQRWILEFPNLSGDYAAWYIGNTIPPPAYPWLETSWSITDVGELPVPTFTIGPC